MTRPTVTSLRDIAVPAYGPTILASTGTGATLPVMALTARDLGASVGMAAFVVALLGLGQLAGDLPAGALVHRNGGAGGAAHRMRRCGARDAGVPARANVAMLAVAVLLVGVANSVFGLARQAYLTDAVDVGLRARALSTLGGVHRIGIFTGPFIAAAVVSAWGINAAYGVGLLASALAFLVVLACRDITADHEGGQPQQGNQRVLPVLARHWRVLLTLGVGVLFISVARSARMAILPLWGEAIGLDAASTSLVFGISGAVDMLLFYPGGWVMDRYGRMPVHLGRHRPGHRQRDQRGDHADPRRRRGARRRARPVPRRLAADGRLRVGAGAGAHQRHRRRSIAGARGARAGSVSCSSAPGGCGSGCRATTRSRDGPSLRVRRSADELP